MERTSYSPIKELFETKLGQWLDFKSFLAQRRRILEDPSIILTAEADGKTWKAPFTARSAAVYGCLFPEGWLEGVQEA